MASPDVTVQRWLAKHRRHGATIPYYLQLRKDMLTCSVEALPAFDGGQESFAPAECLSISSRSMPGDKVPLRVALGACCIPSSRTKLALDSFSEG
mmetsp:Transcript_56549/g.181562  ORF Transcript_56549/g.181562 Transcript_56549/m.181562 type:complete len:95 (+) Transcript_56549:629-913(+)